MRDHLRQIFSPSPGPPYLLAVHRVVISFEVADFPCLPRKICRTGDIAAGTARRPKPRIVTLLVEAVHTQQQVARTIRFEDPTFFQTHFRAVAETNYAREPVRRHNTGEPPDARARAPHLAARFLEEEFFVITQWRGGGRSLCEDVHLIL